MKAIRKTKPHNRKVKKDRIKIKKRGNKLFFSSSIDKKKEHRCDFKIYFCLGPLLSIVALRVRGGACQLQLQKSFSQLRNTPEQLRAAALAKLNLLFCKLCDTLARNQIVISLQKF